MLIMVNYYYPSIFFVTNGIGTGADHKANGIGL
jgi:hypothetical protein